MIYFYKDSIASANLIGADKFLEIRKEALLFDNIFKLGSTPCVSFTIKVLKGAIGSFTNILVVEDGTLMHTLQLDSVDTSNDTADTYVLNDYMIRFNANYDASSLIYPSGSTEPTAVTYMQILQDICSKNNVTCGVSSFTGSSKTTTQINNTISGRSYISYLAELDGSYACISADGKLVFKRYSNTVKATVDARMCASFKVGSQHTITRVVYDIGDVIYSAGNTNGETVYLDTSNVFITEQADVDAVLPKIANLSFYDIEASKCPITTASVGDMIAFTLNGETYPTIVQINQQYNNGWIGGYTTQVANEVQQETAVMGAEQAMRTIKTTIDRTNNTFTREISNIKSNYATKSELTQTEQSITAKVNNTIETLSYTYGYGTSSTTKPADSAFTYTSMPAIQSGKYIWRRTKETKVDESTSYTYEMIQGATGAQGETGAAGINGTNNMLYDTYRATLSAVTASQDRYFSGNSDAYIKATIEAMTTPYTDLEYGVVYELIAKDTSGATTRGYAFYNSGSNDTQFNEGQKYTVSCWAKKLAGTPVQSCLFFELGNTIGNYTNTTISIADLTTSWKRYSWTFTATASIIAKGSRVKAGGLWIPSGSSDAVGLKIACCGFKLEEGEEATDWCKSIADISVDILGNDLATLSKKIEDNQSTFNQTAEGIRGDVIKVSTDLGAVKGSLVNYAKTTEVKSAVEQSASNLKISFTEEVSKQVGDVKKTTDKVETYFDFNGDDGLVIGNNKNPIRAKLDQDSLDFINLESSTIAQFDANEGLMTSKISIGVIEKDNQGQVISKKKQWQIIPWQNGTHLRFTRHS